MVSGKEHLKGAEEQSYKTNASFFTEHNAKVNPPGTIKANWQTGRDWGDKQLEGNEPQVVK